MRLKSGISNKENLLSNQCENVSNLVQDIITDASISFEDNMNIQNAFDYLQTVETLVLVTSAERHFPRTHHRLSSLRFFCTFDAGIRIVF